MARIPRRSPSSFRPPSAPPCDPPPWSPAAAAVPGRDPADPRQTRTDQQSRFRVTCRCFPPSRGRARRSPLARSLTTVTGDTMAAAARGTRFGLQRRGRTHDQVSRRRRNKAEGRTPSRAPGARSSVCEFRYVTADTANQRAGGGVGGAWRRHQRLSRGLSPGFSQGGRRSPMPRPLGGGARTSPNKTVPPKAWLRRESGSEANTSLLWPHGRHGFS